MNLVMKSPMVINPKRVAINLEWQESKKAAVTVFVDFVGERFNSDVAVAYAIVRGHWYELPAELETYSDLTNWLAGLSKRVESQKQLNGELEKFPLVKVTNIF